MKIRKSVLKDAIREVIVEGTFAKGTVGGKSSAAPQSNLIGKKISQKPIFQTDEDNDGDYGAILKRKSGDGFQMLVIDGNNKIVQDWGSHPSLNGAKKMLQKKLAM